MPLIPLHGSIPDPVYDHAFYVLTEEQLSPNEYRYKGRIGFGMSADEYRASCAEDGDPVDEARICTDYEYPYVSFDMRKIQFRFNTGTNVVELETSCRGQVHAEEAHRIPKIHMVVPTVSEIVKQCCIKNIARPVEDILRELQEYAEDKEWVDSYLYFRCPRSKEGIAVSRALQHMFTGKSIEIRYPLILDV